MSELCPSTVIPSLWTGLEYFEHQKVGINWMLERERVGHVCPRFASARFPVQVTGGLLADEMGAGKTITTLATIAMNPCDHTLIVVPKAVIKNWTDNAVRAGFRVFNVTGTGGSARWCQMEAYKATRTSAIYVCGYSSLIYKPHLTESSEPSSSNSSASPSPTSEAILPKWDRVVFDEAHVFRNHLTKLYKEVLEVVRGVRYRWIVTATPIVNKPKDAVSLLAVLGVPATKGRDWNETYYRPLLPILVLHRSMDELRAAVVEMPAKPAIHDVTLPFMSAQEEEYYLMLQLMTKQMERAFRQGRAAQGLELLLRLRQCSLSPELVPDDLVDKYGVGVWPAGMPSSKMSKIRDMVRAEPTKKFLVFCWFHKEMALIDAMLESEGITVEQYHGGMSEAHRNEVLDLARKPECQVLLIQIRSGGVGLNLQEFNRVIFTSPYWTSAMMDQAIGRAVRIGQKEVVQVCHLLMETDMGRNIDTMTTQIAEAKRAMGEAFFAVADGIDLEAEAEAEAEAEPGPEIPLTRMEALAVLGVTNSSDQEAIGKAYRVLALRWHPDKNIGNETAATVQFRRIQEAYDMLTA